MCTMLHGWVVLRLIMAFGKELQRVLHCRRIRDVTLFSKCGYYATNSEFLEVTAQRQHWTWGDIIVLQRLLHKVKKCFTVQKCEHADLIFHLKSSQMI